MRGDKKKTVLIFFLILLGGGGIFILRSRKNWQRIGEKTKVGVKQKKENLLLFVSKTCPHCQYVEQWLSQNSQIKEKSGLIIKEVSENRENAYQLYQKGKECNYTRGDGLGAVPMLYHQGRCVLGDEPIIKYLSENYK